MQGIFINYGFRPKSKAEVKKTIAADPSKARLEATSLHGGEYDGPVSEAPDGVYIFVGPEPGRSHKFYGQIHVRDGKITVK